MARRDTTRGTARPSETAEQVLALWRDCYDDARLVDTPWAAERECALALVHALGFGPDGSGRGAVINGLDVRSPLAAATGTYTAELVTTGVDDNDDNDDNGDNGGSDRTKRSWVNLYRACIPDLPGARGHRSSVQVYAKALEAAGLDVAANASLFTGLCWPLGRGAEAQVRVVTHQNVGLDPVEFARRTLVALGAAERAVQRRTSRAESVAIAVLDDLDHEIDRLRDRLRTACDRATAVGTGRMCLPQTLPSSSSSSLKQAPTSSLSSHGRHGRERRTRRDRRRGRGTETTTRHADERSWCAKHERWERVDVSCVDPITCTSATDATATGDSTEGHGKRHHRTDTSHGPTHSCCSECCSFTECSCSCAATDDGGD